jgi:membrane fusion protein (multidrug efflux system)
VRPEFRLVASLALSGVLVGLAACSGEPTADARPGNGEEGPETVPVVVTHPELASLEDVFLEREATLRPIVTTTISAQQEGVIRRIPPEVGDAVHEGDLLVDLNDIEYRLRLDERRADQQKAEVTLEERKRAWARIETLYKKNIISEDERDDVRLSLDRAQAEWEQARVRVERAEVDVQALRILAPFPGVISTIHADVGSYVQRADAILELKRVDWIVALCTVSERDLVHVHEGGSARVTLPAFPGRVFEGLIWKIVPDALVASRSFPVKILLKNPQIELKSGMSARIAFVRRVEDALLVPKDAVEDDGDEQVVWIADEGRAARRVVELGSAFGDRWHVRRGLSVGESVIVTGNEFLEPDTRVEIAVLPPPGPPTLPAAQGTPPDPEKGS